MYAISFQMISSPDILKPKVLIKVLVVLNSYTLYFINLHLFPTHQ